jgi:hypothetical protein
VNYVLGQVKTNVKDRLSGKTKAGSAGSKKDTSGGSKS